MEAEKIEKIQTFASPLIFVTAIAVAYGFAYQKQPILLAGMFGLGAALLVQAVISFAALRQRQHESDLKFRFALWGDALFAGAQFLLGIFMLLGAFADLTGDYLSSGEFWQQVSRHPALFFSFVGLFFSFVGIAQIAANLKPEGDGFADKVWSFNRIIKGIFFLLVGLFILGIMIFANLP